MTDVAVTRLLIIVRPNDRCRLSKDPFRALFDKLVHQQAQVGQDEAANVEGEELGSVADAEFKADVRLRRVLEARIFDLTGDLICDGERIG